MILFTGAFTLTCAVNMADARKRVKSKSYLYSIQISKQ